MNERWSLDELYKSCTCNEFTEDFKNYKESIKEINIWSNKNFSDIANPVNKLETFLKKLDDIGNYTKISHYLFLRLSVNSDDNEALKLLNQYEDVSTDMSVCNVLFKEFLQKLDDVEALISQSKDLQEYKFLILDCLEQSKYMLSEKEEVLLSKMKTTGSSSWEKLRDSLISGLSIPITIDGCEKKLPFAEVRNLAYSHEKDVRKLAYEQELLSYKNIETSGISCLNSVKSEAITESSMRGYSSLLEKTLLDSRMNFEVFNALIDAIKESLPSLRRFYVHKSKKLGYTNGLPFYELFAPLGQENLQFTYDEAADNIVNIFNGFSPILGDFAKNAFENNWIDATPMAGKSDGAFCDNIHVIKESRILSNFTGSYSDMLTIAHELGHAFHGECLKNEKYLNSEYPMPIAETASIFCETIMGHHYLSQAKGEEKIAILNNSLTEATQLLIDIYSRFLFEDNFIRQRELGSLSVAEAKEMMLDAQKEAYGDGLDKEYLHDYMWLAKSHYYSADYNYYNFPYAFGLLFAKGVYGKYVAATNKEAFVADYQELLCSTGKNSLIDVAKKMDIDITSKDFWLSSISVINEEIEEFLKY